MAKVLLIGTLDAGAMFHAKAALDTLGIEADLMAVVGGSTYSLLQPVAGVSSAFTPSTTAMRNFLRRYDAVLLFVAVAADSSLNWLDPTLNVWMQSWNAPEDPPVFHFGQNINTARTGLSLPADFPIIRANTADIANTMWRWQESMFNTVGPQRARIGARVKFLREGISVYTRAYNLYWGSDCAAYLIDTTVSGEGTVWERLIVPDFPDQSRLASVPINRAAVFGLRYRNHYFLPNLHTSVALFMRLRSDTFASRDGQALLWLLYALKLAGIVPSRRLPIVLEFDHFAEAGYSGENIYGRTRLEQVQMIRDTLYWVRDFARERGLQVPFTNHSFRLSTSGAESGNSFYSLCFTGATFPPADREAGKAVCNEIRALLQANPEVFGAGLHDHAAPGDGFNATNYGTVSFPRHSGADYPYGAPNLIPTGHGTVVNRRVAPANYQPDGSTVFAFEVGGVPYLEVNPPTTTSATLSNVRDGSYWVAQVILERNIADHDALGLAWKGTFDYTNLAKNLHGGLGYWEAMRQRGFRGVRVFLAGQRLPCGDMRNLRYHALQFVPSAQLDMCAGAAGFYHSSATYSDTMFGMWGLEATSGASANDLRGATGPGQEWMNDPDWRAEKGVVAIRRYLSAMLDMWLWTALVLRGTGYAHPLEFTWNSPTQVLADPFTGTAGNLYWTGAFNYIKELLVEMDNLIRLLPDYLKWGTIGELMAIREELG